GGIVSAVGAEALTAGGKRLRPLLVFLATPPSEPANVAAGVAVELAHMATLVHDDLIDGAAFRRGRASAWQEFGPDAARAAGDYLFARAFAELEDAGDPNDVALLADAVLCLARGEALQAIDTVARIGSEDVSTSNGRSATARRMRSAISSAWSGGVSGRRIENSSPPNRAGTS